MCCQSTEGIKVKWREKKIGDEKHNAAKCKQWNQNYIDFRAFTTRFRWHLHNQYTHTGTHRYEIGATHLKIVRRRPHTQRTYTNTLCHDKQRRVNGTKAAELWAPPHNAHIRLNRTSFKKSTTTKHSLVVATPCMLDAYTKQPIIISTKYLNNGKMAPKTENNTICYTLNFPSWKYVPFNRHR